MSDTGKGKISEHAFNAERSGLGEGVGKACTARFTALAPITARKRPFSGRNQVAKTL